MMTPEQQLLVFIGAKPQAVDPIRIMKGMFIFTMRVQEDELPPQEGCFAFGPMSYGPCSPDIYGAIDSLQRKGVISSTPVPGETWSEYTATERGRREAEAVASGEDVRSAGFLQQVRDWCDKQSFTSLLRAVYSAYPAYAARSVLPHLRPNR